MRNKKPFWNVDDIVVLFMFVLLLSIFITTFLNIFNTTNTSIVSNTSVISNTTEESFLVPLRNNSIVRCKNNICYYYEVIE